MTLDIVVLPGDGVGPEVTDEAVRVLDWFVAKRGVPLRMTRHLFGSASWTAQGTTMPDETWAAIMAADALLFGAVGSLDQKQIPAEERRKGSLLRMRKGLDVFANLRPVRAWPALAESSPFKARTVAGADLIFVRELTAGMYFGTPRGIETQADGTRRGVNTHTYTEAEIARVARFALGLARTRRNHLTSVDKANVMEAGALWREVVTAIHAAEFPDVTLEHMLADNCALQLGRAPTRFDVIVTDNLFGDLLSDCAGAINGSLGMLPSAALSAPDANGRRRALYEPIHGSAPDIAGKGIANPLGAILSAALLLRWTAQAPAEADRLEAAVEAALAGGARTADIALPGEPVLSTRAMADAVIAALDAAP
ncbi:3-isopropylmalate dehydrogenase [Neoroseomonas oryzicola]|uniref:3-isopropylmalate dehydrogenase n=1 Tax=Neoroseomonas oryzicola TaxID=535904 RepID=A0A9X9WNI2_9PROT|nr:3-isopropylmalate dehydrogenase [Neoroseomonas oryzicola]MBR0661892.1 3-isopropylmalate dehydrogenase [Neoroseomonas oryzicola]NKE17057.1 3-isopropylmalate dehydrogenase [Neoroseomonas oryzicola]